MGRTSTKMEYFKSPQHQRKFMDELYSKLKLNSKQDWLEITKQTIIDNGGKSLLTSFYDNDMKKLLSSIYPEHSWESFNRKLSILNHRKSIDRIFLKLNLQNLEDWKQVSINNFKKKGGEEIIKFYSHNMENCLQTIYPNYPWKKISFESPSQSFSRDYFRSIENQRKYLDFLFRKFYLQNLDDWLEISSYKIIQNGGTSLLSLYSFDRKKLLSNVYPDHPWQFEKLKINNKKENDHKSLVYLRFMNKLFRKFRLNSLDDWLNISRSQILQCGGKEILLYYNNNLKTLFSSIYPNHNWNFDNMKMNVNEYFKSIENQRKFMDDLYSKLNFVSLNEWLFTPKSVIVDHGGFSLLSYYYENDMKKLLSSIYPNHHWKFDVNLNEVFSIEIQVKKMEILFIKLKLKSLNDWLKVPRLVFERRGGKNLLDFYSNDMKKLLSTIYPNHLWQFDRMKFRPTANYSKSFSFHFDRLNFLRGKYLIRKKKDWYRVSVNAERISISKSLKFVFPNEKWEKKLFQIRSRKSTQRLLFAYLYYIYPTTEILESYRHPHLYTVNNNIFELDVFIPSVNLGFEYQGEQHYDDIPSAFSQLELYQSRDREKEELSEKQQIKLITIPYWWDKSQSSLFSSILLSLRNLL